MANELPTYRIYIDLDDNTTGVDSNSLVHDPAHELEFMTFNKQKVVKMNKATLNNFVNNSFKDTQQFNDESQIVTGVAISADQPIYRHDGEDEYNVTFSKDDIKDIVHDYARKGRFNNLNIEHNPNDVVDGAYMVMLYQVDNDNGLTAPEKFKDVSDGSLIMSYKVVNQDLWGKIKSGEILGYSIEGTFVIDDMDFSTDKNVEKRLDELIELLEK